jgi:hypothetical protein
MGQGTPAPVRVYRVRIEATARPSIRRLSTPHTRMVWPRARRTARAVLRYLGQCVGLWVVAANHPARVDNLWEQSLENRQNLIPRKRRQGTRLRSSM